MMLSPLPEALTIDGIFANFDLSNSVNEACSSVFTRVTSLGVCSACMKSTVMAVR